MFKVIVTEAVISKGFNGAAALRFSENNGAVQFKIGKRVYDKTAEDNHRYINIAVKAFGQVCERAGKMKLKEGSYINLIGRLDEEQWEDNGEKRSRFVIIADEIEYAGGNGNGTNSNGTGTGQASQTQNGQGVRNQSPPPSYPNEQPGIPGGFAGYESFGGENPFFPNGN